MKEKKGFTLVEIIIVIVLLIVISGIFTINMIASRNRQKDKEKEDTETQIISAANAYVSTNPKEIENLYNGYGFVDIPVGDLRDSGYLKEELADPETGIKIADELLVRVRLDMGNELDFTYPANQEGGNGYKLVAEDLNISFSDDETDWCGDDKNYFAGLRDSRYSNIGKYDSVEGKLYLISKDGKYYDKDYFVDAKLSKKTCNVNPKIPGTYTITYSYIDPILDVERNVTRVVNVRSSNTDSVSFTAVINNNQNIVRGWGKGVPITITENYKDGTKAIINTTIDDLNKGNKYSLKNFNVDKVGNFKATLTKLEPNSDGSTPDPCEPKYNVIPDTYKLTFNPNGGSVSTTSKIVTYMMKYGNLPVPSRTGYMFLGWYTSTSGGSKVESTTIMDKLYDHTIFAQWRPQNYTVTFNANGGSTGTSTKTVTYDSTYGTLPTPTRSGYTFAGWYTSSSGGTRITASSSVNITSNQTLYAHWNVNQYTVYFNGNGGTSNQSSKVVTYGSRYGTLPSAYRSNYSFLGWYTSSSGGSQITSSSTYYQTSSQTLYARWQQNSYNYSSHSSYSPSSGGGGSSSSRGSSSGSTSSASTCGNVCQMQRNSAQWANLQSQKNGNAAHDAAISKQQNALHEANKNLAPSGSSFNSASGKWYTNSSQTTRLYTNSGSKNSSSKSSTSNKSSSSSSSKRK